MPSRTEPSPSRAGSVRRFFSRPANYLAKDFIARIRQDIVADAFRGLDPCDVLDVGCGDGRISRMLLSRGHQVTCLDPSPEMLALARQNAASIDDARAELIEGTLDSIPSGRRFNVVLCLGLMAHIPSIEDTLASIARVAMPDAQIAIQITDAGSLIGSMTSRYSAWHERHFHQRGYQLNETTLKTLVDRAGRHGLKLDRTYRYSLVIPGMMRLLPNRLLYLLSALSRRWPFRLAGGEVIAVFRPVAT